MELEQLLVHALHLSPDECAGKVVVVTGAGQGIGLQAARAFAVLGARVVIAELSEVGCQAAEAINRAGGTALFVQVDVSDAGSVRRLAETVHQAFGPVDILVNNAIRIAAVPVIEMDEAQWDSILGVNLRGTFLTCKAFLPDMQRRGQGTIINMVSTDAMPGLSAYIASKQGINGFTQSLALEVEQFGVNVIPFAPGMVDTPGMRSVIYDLAPRLGMTAEQFMSVSLHPAYDGFMPVEHAGAATVYLAARLAGAYHGQLVNGYEVLERAGLLPVPGLESPVAAVEPAVQPEIAASQDAAGLVTQLRDMISETAAEFEKLPAFIRPLARNGFKGKAGASLDDWQRSLAALSSQVEAGKLSSDTARGFLSRLEKLIVYYEGVPAETARFTRDKALLAEIAELSNRRVAVIRQLIQLLKQI